MKNNAGSVVVWDGSELQRDKEGSVRGNAMRDHTAVHRYVTVRIKKLMLNDELLLRTDFECALRKRTSKVRGILLASLSNPINQSIYQSINRTNK